MMSYHPSSDPDQKTIGVTTFPPYDLLLKGGRVVDPASGLDAICDVALAHGRVAAIGTGLADSDAIQVLNVTGKIVTPGLIDLHAHIYEGVTPLSLPVDELCLTNGVTTVVSAGDAGSATFVGFVNHVARVARTRVYGFVHISRIGLAGYPVGEMRDLAYADVRGAAHIAREYPEFCLGIKVRETTFIVGNNGVEPLRKAIEAATQASTRVMVHIYDIPGTLPDLLAMLRPGDIVTHVYMGTENGILDESGRLLPAVIEARHRGVLFDIGHGSKAGFSLSVATKAIEQGFLPDTISTDAHTQSVNGTMCNMPYLLSKFMNLGLSLSDIIARVTMRPAQIINSGLIRAPGLGTLSVGAPGDVAVLELVEAEGSIRDDLGGSIPADHVLRVAHTVRAGQIYGAPYRYPKI